jgi:hypothetical protein
VIPGREGFLDYSTATFIGKDRMPELKPNNGIPRV